MLVDFEERVLVAAGNTADRVTQLGWDAVGELPLNPVIRGSRGTVVRGKRRLGAVEQRPKLLIGRILRQQLPYPADCLLNPRLPPAAELTVDDTPFEAIPVTFKFEVDGRREFVFVVIGEGQGGISMPHRVQVQQVLISVAEVTVHVVDVGDVAYAILYDHILKYKGIDLCFVDD